MSPVDRLRGAEGGLFYFAMRRLAGYTAKTYFFNRKTIAGAEYRADVVHAADIIQHDYHRQLFLFFEFRYRGAVKFVEF